MWTAGLVVHGSRNGGNCNYSEKLFVLAGLIVLAGLRPSEEVDRRSPSLQAVITTDCLNKLVNFLET